MFDGVPRLIQSHTAMCLLAMSACQTVYAQDAVEDAPRQPAVTQATEPSTSTSEERPNEAMSVRDLLLFKLSGYCNSQIETATMALDQFEKESLKSYAQQVIDEHRELKDAVIAAKNSNDQLASRRGLTDRRRDGSGRRVDEAADNVEDVEVEDVEVVEENNGEGGNSEKKASEEAQRSFGEARGERRPRLRLRGQSPQVPAELCEIIQRSNENSLRMTKELLSAYEGQDFQMAYLGQQAITLTLALAEMEAMQSSTGFQDLKPLVQQAISLAKRHVDAAKQLADQFEKDAQINLSPAETK